MNSKEIRERVNEIKEALEGSAKLGIFQLNPQARSLLIEWERIRSNCSHDFQSGECIYCDEQR